MPRICTGYMYCYILRNCVLYLQSSLLVRWGLCAVSNCTNDGISSHIKEIVNGMYGFYAQNI